jgi:outer membrane immunogenic protein
MVRRLLLSTTAAAAMLGSAYAADLPSRRPPPVAYAPPVPIFTWTGFYLGVNAGGAFRAHNNTGFNNAVFFGGAAPFFGPGFVGNNNNGNNARFIGGGQAGVNYQIGQFVIGVEGDGQALVGSSNNNNNNNFGFANNTNGSNIGFLGTVRGRAGIAVDRLLVYGTGGVAFGGNNNFPNTTFGAVGGVPTFFTANNRNNMRVGFAAGAGVEYAFTPNWSVKLEYLYADLGRNNRTFLAPGGFAGFTVNNREQDHIVRAGLNYRFGWWGGPAPVLARY